MEMDGKEYFVTKPELARKMIEKIPDEEWKKAENILTVNSKVGEWVIEIYKKYGKEVANRVKIVPAGEKTKLFIKKSLNILGLDEYNILDIEDKNGNSLFDITNDFINEDNEKIIELAGMPKGKKFDICIMNPPYEKNLHLKFLEKVEEISNNIISIQPITWLQNIFADENKNAKINSIKLTDIEFIGKINDMFDTNGHATYDIGILTVNKDAKLNKEFIDELRIVNANLEISLEDFDVYRSEL